MQYFKMASDKEYNADLAAVCSEEKKFILRALQYCQDDASSRKGWWYDIFARCFFFSLDLFDLFLGGSGSTNCYSFIDICIYSLDLAC